ncbi:MAG: methyl-accepting chemotaxis protein [Nitrospirae bacterium]|nr:MAG: methyl-accepting chemotaxis protein [Nitrospirota bacterium]
MWTKDDQWGSRTTSPNSTPNICGRPLSRFFRVNRTPEKYLTLYEEARKGRQIMARVHQIKGIFATMRLTPKLVGLLVLFAVIPMGIVAFIGFVATNDIEARVGKQLERVAVNVADKIDRNLSERYGDVQAFAINRIVQERYNWYQPDEAENEIVQAMNDYVKTYGIYYLTLFVDTEGDVIAVNTRDDQGNPIDTAFLYKKNFKDAPWFQALKAGIYTTKMAYTAEGNDGSTGTFIEDVHVDPLVKAVYPQESGLTLGFSAPVYQEGEVIGYWSNRAKFSLVESIFQQTYKELAALGWPGTELTLLDGNGYVLIDYDPVRQQTSAMTHDFEKTLMKLNLVDRGLAIAKQAILGKTGYANIFDDHKNLWQEAGYTHLKGALGYPGMNWAVLVRVPMEEANSAAIAIRRSLWLALLVCGGLVIPLGMLIGRAVVRQLKPVMDVAERASQGDLTARVPVKTADELGQMGEAFNRFLDTLNRMLGQTASVAHTVAAAAEQLSANGQQVATASREQASQSMHVASSVEEMSATANEMSKNAQVMASTANDLSQTAVQGGEVVANSMRGMDIVAKTMQSSAERIQLLGQRSQEIGEIIRVIEDIADQTNLLALNAAIEAARAGEQGRGFAVVADEVRKLAERTGKATKEIASVIETVQAGTKEAVVSMEAGTAEVQNGMQLVNEAGVRLNEIVEGVQKVTQMVQQMASSIEEQTQVTEQIAGSVQSVAGLSQQNENSVEQVVAATSDLARTAAQLQSELQRFRLQNA